MGKFRFNLMTSVSGASFICCLLTFFGETQVSRSIEIRRLSVPRWVENGTKDFVILDCEYMYNENDMRMVVKWFLNDNPEPVYQWIPELNRRYTSRLMKDRLDMNFSVSTVDAYSKFRAMRIIRPTTEMSGTYRCYIVSMAGQDGKEKSMTIYVPPKKFDVFYTDLGDSMVNVTCEALELFPVPVLKLYVGSSLGDLSETTADITISSTQENSGAYDAYLYRTFNISELKNNCSIIVFECYVELPGTDISRTKRISYYSREEESLVDAEHSISSISHERLASLYLIIGSITTVHIFTWIVYFSVDTPYLKLRTSYNKL